MTEAITYWTPERVKCLRRCGLQMSREEFARQAIVGHYSVKVWEQAVTAKKHQYPGEHSAYKLLRAARDADWNDGKCAGLCQ